MARGPLKVCVGCRVGYPGSGAPKCRHLRQWKRRPERRTMQKQVKRLIHRRF